jgi:hypothetical protein
VTLAAVLLMIFGAVLTLFGIVFVLSGLLFETLRTEPELIDQLGSLPPSTGAVILAIGLVILTCGVLDIVAAGFVLRRRTWARYTAIVLAVLGTLAGLALSLPDQEGVNAVRMTFTLTFLLGHAFAIWALSRAGGWFTGR